MGILKPLKEKISTQAGLVKRLQVYSKARLPTAHGVFDCAVFRDSEGLEHVALIKGDVANQAAMLCRVHSECLTSEVFDSLKCDCRQQLDRALEQIQASERGILIYLRQEGRGIGLGNKIKAYALQEDGLDTVEANEALGLPADARDYQLASEILKQLEVKSVRLMTNNPHKLKDLEESGIKVSREPLELKELSQLAADYVGVKERRLGHFRA
ncbi:MAG: GTP cyclohydrolase II [Deltaproteobacteria bacterium]|nr:GTP cyclohydrolase II [Deltaproteobacteria bacterium]